MGGGECVVYAGGVIVGGEFDDYAAWVGARDGGGVGACAASGVSDGVGYCAGLVGEACLYSSGCDLECGLESDGAEDVELLGGVGFEAAYVVVCG